MKLSLHQVKVLYRKKPKFKKRRKSSKKRKEAQSKSSPNLLGTMDNTSGAEAEINESTSSMSCSINEFETFADEVNGEIPEVDCRGNMKSEKSLSDVDETSSSLTQSQIIKADRTPNFFKSLLSSRSPYDEFHRLFKTVPMDQFPINDFSCALSREILLQGRIYVSQGWVCFYSNIFGWETQVTIDCKKIQSITREKTAYVVPNAILICTDEEKHFFSSFLSRENVYKLLVQVWDEVRNKQKSDISNEENQVSGPFPVEQETQGVDDEPDAGEDIVDNYVFNEDRVCCTEEHGEDSAGCVKCQKTGQTPTDMLACDETENGRITLSTGNNKLSSLSGKDQLNSSESSRITGFAGIAVLIASLAETVYSYLQVSFRLALRLSREQPFYVVTTIMIICLMMCSLFLLHRISLLEPKIMAKTAHPPEKILLHQSMYQLWKLRQEVFDAEVLRFKTIVAANLNAITQVRKTLKMLEDDLEAQISRNCTLLDDNLCVQI